MNADKTITGEVVGAYCACPRKAYLLLHGEPAAPPHEFTTAIEARAATSFRAFLDGRRAAGDNIEAARESRPWDADIITGVDLVARGCAARIDALTSVTKRRSDNAKGYEPLLVTGGRVVSRSDKMRLAFACHVLADTPDFAPTAGAILNGTGEVSRFRVSDFGTDLRPILRAIRNWIEEPASSPPSAILNEHCRQCPFQDACLEEAEKKDDLSLLQRMTPKVMKKYHKKGIFTVQQLSYLFRPRRQRKRRTNASPPTFRFELQALAIQSGRTYIHEVPELPESSPELFLDIEGLPDDENHYLIGLLVVWKEHAEFQSWWANCAEEEEAIFRGLLDTAATYPGAPIYHYGSYEPKAIKYASGKYGASYADLLPRLVNVNSLVFGKVYLPARSNSLKDLGACVGASWSTPDASGLRSIAWRLQWEETRSSARKDRLIVYNREDCEALRLLVTHLKNLKHMAATRPDVQFTDDRRTASTSSGQEIHDSLQGILRSAHAEYQRNRLSIRDANFPPPSAPKKLGAPKGHPGYQRISPSRATRTVRVRRALRCARHPDVRLEPTERLAERVQIDLAFTKNGCRKTITKLIGWMSRCPSCSRLFLPPAITRHGKRLFGHGFRAWVVYQRVVLRLPFAVMVQVIRDLFSEHLSPASALLFIQDFARLYARTERLLLKKILQSPFVHIDETRINIRGADQFVWVLTDGRHVIFRLTPTREAAHIHRLLDGYEGVLISDFYAGYDACNCRQQKCLVHLIRDMNEDLWKNPYNVTFEAFIGAFKDLLVPMMADVQRYGLKRRHLNKHRRRVEAFYSKWICGKEYADEIIRTYQKRFLRYRESLFRFLDEDGIPWNNNTAERGIRQLAVQRKISGFFYERGAKSYLTLLGIAQSCRFQEKSFLRFLLSGESDVDSFRDRKIRRPVRRAEPASQVQGS
jgi:predicted RecB family nuclease